MQKQKSYREALGGKSIKQNNEENNEKPNEENNEENNEEFNEEFNEDPIKVIKHLAPNQTNYITIPYDRRNKHLQEPMVIYGFNFVKGELVIKKQKEQYHKEFSFELMKLNNYYVVKEKPDYYGAEKFDSCLMLCIGKETDKDGKNWVTYGLISDPDDYLGCRYIVIKSSVFSTKKFRRLPHDYSTNPYKYSNIDKEYYVDHVELTGIY